MTFQDNSAEKIDLEYMLLHKYSRYSGEISGKSVWHEISPPVQKLCCQTGANCSAHLRACICVFLGARLQITGR